MTTLAQLAPAHVVGSLKAYGFRIDAQSQTCSHFIEAVRAFVEKFCSSYDAEIDAELQRNRSAKRQDLVSWSNDEIVRIMHGALGLYCAEIVRHAAIDLGSNRIECQDGLKDFRLLVDFVERSKSESDARHLIPPKSQRMQIKRREQLWKPYGLSIGWAALKDFAKKMASP